MPASIRPKGNAQRIAEEIMGIYSGTSKSKKKKKKTPKRKSGY